MKLLFALANFEKIIKNVNIPSCGHFKPYYSSDFTSSLSKCGTKDITDKISYNEYADITGSDQTKCGKKGKYFEQEKNINDVIVIIKKVIFKNVDFIIIMFISYFLTQVK